MTTTTESTLVAADNGYFETHVRPCGHRVRIVTEYDQHSIRRDAAVLPRLRAAALARPCSQCQS